MNTNLRIILMSSFLCCKLSYSQCQINGTSKRIVIGGEIPPGYSNDFVDLTTFPLENITYFPKEKINTSESVTNGMVKWVLYSDKPLYISTPFLRPSVVRFCAEPGDSIQVNYINNNPVFTGKGSLKYNLARAFGRIEDSLENTRQFKMLSPELVDVYSLNDYLSWNAFLNQKAKMYLLLLESYKGKISDVVYFIYKEKVLNKIESDRADKFSELVRKCIDYRLSGKKTSSDSFSLSNLNLCEIYDSTLYGPSARWLQFNSPVVGDPYYLYRMLSLDIQRMEKQFLKYNVKDSSTLKRTIDSYVARYNLAKTKYKGVRREEVLAFFFHYVRGAIHNVGFQPEIEKMLADYYAQPGYPEYKSVVREYELDRRRLLAGAHNLDFNLTDVNGKVFTKGELRGKVAVLDFWFTGCKGCIQMVPELLKLENRFKNDTNVVFLNVSIDEQKDKWLRSLKEKKYTTGGGLSLYTGGEGASHSILRNFGIDGYPSILLIDALGGPVFMTSDKDPRHDGGKGLIEEIEKQLNLKKDGPYVSYEKEKVVIRSIDGTVLSQKNLDDRIHSSFKVQTDRLDKSFAVTLKDSITIEPCEFSMPSKLVAISDIEGNFDALSKLLKVNKVIDEDYNWIFGDGHLVFVGDMFDRGKQVTECLWLLYSLEDKAKRNGGYVHFILGNHEIMNLQGNNKYTEEKYKSNALLMQDSISNLYGKNSELGRWLRSKNVVERIGDLLFVHAGISPEVNRLTISLNEINNLARPYYDKGGAVRSNRGSEIIMSQLGPLWFRGYYNDRVDKEHIDSTLKKFEVNKIVTGHTIISDNISVHYDGKVINIDTEHKNGKSEALLIENGNYYRVHVNGNETLLISCASYGTLKGRVAK